MPADARPATIDHLLFVGIFGCVLALDRRTGQTVWSATVFTPGALVTLLADGDCVFAASAGYVTCLDALTGAQRWQVSLALGFNLATLATARSNAALSDAILANE
jgi:outer membrane protein assembly factor BamB